MRKKLIELLQEANDVTSDGILNGRLADVETAWNFLADHIIANGVVLAVRCKDCKYAKQHPIFPYSRKCRNEDYRLPHRADHFCSYGERKASDLE